MCLEDTVRIPLRARDGSVLAYTLIDAANVEWANQWRWCLSGAGYAARGDRSTGRFRMVSLHRELLGLVRGDGIECDHLNRDRLDNRRSNLRMTTRQGNSQNLPGWRNASSAYRGVAWNKRRGMWEVSVKVNGRKHSLGCFVDELEAAKAAQDGRARLMPMAVD